jgi:hypothetical protein
MVLVVLDINILQVLARVDADQHFPQELETNERWNLFPAKTFEHIGPRDY